MNGRERIEQDLRVAAGQKADLAGRSSSWTGGGEFANLAASDTNPNEAAREQRLRFLSRHDDPDTSWNAPAADAAEPSQWDDFIRAYEDAITATSTGWAPWYVIPADDPAMLEAFVVAVIVDAARGTNLQRPTNRETSPAAP